jgi:hypothetical protein
MRERERIRFCLHSEVKDLLYRVTPTDIVSEKGVVSERTSKEKQLMDTNDASKFLGISKNTFKGYPEQGPVYQSRAAGKVPECGFGRMA